MLLSLILCKQNATLVESGAGDKTVPRKQTEKLCIIIHDELGKVGTQAKFMKGNIWNCRRIRYFTCVITKRST